MINYEHGFSISAQAPDGTFTKLLAQFPYEKLKMSSDDGVKMLFLDFGAKDGDIVSIGDLIKNAKNLLTDCQVHSNSEFCCNVTTNLHVVIEP